MSGVEDRIRERLRPMLEEWEADRLETIRRRAEAEPRKYKTTSVFDARKTNYNYVPAGKDPLDRRWGGCKVSFCWSCWRNVAGYFLTWREREWTLPDGSKRFERDRVEARKVRKRCKAIALERVEAFKAAAIAALPEAPPEVKAEVDRLIDEG